MIAGAAASSSIDETTRPKILDLPLSGEAGGHAWRAAEQEPDGAAPGFRLARPHEYSDSFAEMKARGRKCRTWEDGRLQAAVIKFN